MYFQNYSDIPAALNGPYKIVFKCEYAVWSYNNQINITSSDVWVLNFDYLKINWYNDQKWNILEKGSLIPSNYVKRRGK